MERRSLPAAIPIGCGTTLVVAALLLVGFQMALSAADVRDHRVRASALLRNDSIERVTLSEWEPPSVGIAWLAAVGGLVMIATGLHAASSNPSTAKTPRRDDLE